MALKTSARGAVPPFIVMEVLRHATRQREAGGDVMHLELGQPMSGPPKAVIARAEACLANGRIGYTEALGIRPLRERIAAHYGETYGVAIAADRVVVTTGSSGALLLAILAAFDPGDRVALVAPNYPGCRNMLQALGIETVILPAGRETRFQPSPALLERVAGRLDGLVVASPSNPAGTVLRREELCDIARYCEARGVRLVSDEIYHGITYGQKAATAAEFSESAVIINSFSKYFAMTGWRLGWMIAPDDLLGAIDRLQQNFFISSPALSQDAALAAFDSRAELDAIVAEYARNRELLLRELPKAGFANLAPAEGAFYIYADVANLTNDSQAFCARMLAETGVAAVPGIDFDPERGHHFIRFSFAAAHDVIAHAAERLVAWRR